MVLIWAMLATKNPSHYHNVQGYRQYLVYSIIIINILSIAYLNYSFLCVHESLYMIINKKEPVLRYDRRFSLSTENHQVSLNAVDSDVLVAMNLTKLCHRWNYWCSIYALVDRCLQYMGESIM